MDIYRYPEKHIKSRTANLKMLLVTIPYNQALDPEDLIYEDIETYFYVRGGVQFPLSRIVLVVQPESYVKYPNFTPSDMAMFTELHRECKRGFHKERRKDGFGKKKTGRPCDMDEKHVRLKRHLTASYRKVTSPDSEPKNFMNSDSRERYAVIDTERNGSKILGDFLGIASWDGRVFLGFETQPLSKLEEGPNLVVKS
ncbi:hypothetical protein J6590_076400 [Homalodisca vitripennis]|nr:hypothetical protein J6590_076400 [Homalodisca vitripennis]